MYKRLDLKIDLEISLQSPIAMKISVIKPVYNTALFLSSSIESILEKTFSDFEFLIVNDGSTDASLDIIQDYAKKDHRSRCVNLSQNRGMPCACKHGIRSSRTPLFARMDADDIAFPERLQKQCNYMKEHPEVRGLGC